MESRSKILVFKTNLETEDGIRAVSSVLNDHPGIFKWTVDRWDVDNVLRIEAVKHHHHRCSLTLFRALALIAMSYQIDRFDFNFKCT